MLMPQLKLVKQIAKFYPIDANLFNIIRINNILGVTLMFYFIKIIYKEKKEKK